MIIWGTKIKRRILGYVADYCPICREPRLFELIRIGVAGHLYFVSITQGRLAGHEIACCTCGLRIPTEHDTYDDVLDDDDVGIQTAIQRTYPHLATSEENKALIAFDKRVRAGRLSAEERRAAMSTPLQLLEPDLARQKQERSWSPAGRVVGTVVAVLTIPVLALLQFRDDEPAWVRWLFMPIVLAWIVGLFAILYFIVTCMRYHIRHELEPRIALALVPLDPSPEELDAVYRELRDEKYAIAKKTKPHRVLDLTAKLKHKEQWPA